MKPEPLWQFDKETIGASCLTRVEAPVFFVLGRNADFLGVRGLSLWKKLLGYGKILERWQATVIVE